MSNVSSSPTINNVTPSELISRKRKRSIKKTVRFDVERTVIIDTYSPLDYDRGSIFSFPIQYEINPNILSATHKYIPSLSLEIPATPSSPCDSEASSPDMEQIQSLAASTIDNKKKRPKLTVNTSLCSGDGPLFFTRLSTNHVRHKVNNEDDDEDDTTNDFLIPITSSRTIAKTFSF